MCPKDYTPLLHKRPQMREIPFTMMKIKVSVAETVQGNAIIQIWLILS